MHIIVLIYLGTCIFMSTESSFSSTQSDSPHATTVESSLNSFLTSTDGTTMETLITSGNSLLQSCNSSIIL